MKLLCILFLFSLAFFSSNSYSKTAKFSQFIESVVDQFENGKYEMALDEINILLKNDAITSNSKSKGMLLYWRGLSNIRLNEFDAGIKDLSDAIKLKFNSKDIHYEFGQALYVSERLKEARLAFRESVRNKYKTGVSLYYIAFISQQLLDFKKAVGFYNMIEKLPDAEKKDVLQASRMQTADIYLSRVEKLPNSFASVEKYVIPQYKKALEVNPKSKLAEQIKNKIIEIQKRYDLLVFKMRNGRPTAFPRFFVRGNLGYSIDDNVTASSEDSKEDLEKKDYESGFFDTGIYSRYTLYPNSSFSVSPELTLNYRKYSSESDNIKAFNSLNAIIGTQINIEHTYNDNPATIYLNLDYTYREDDADLDDTLGKASDTFAVTLSEELQVWSGNPTTFRYRYSEVKAVDETLSLNTHSLIWEQVLTLKSFSIFFFTAYDMNTYNSSDSLDNNTSTLRADFLLPTFFGLFNPNLYLSGVNTSYRNNEDRGDLLLIDYGGNFSRPLSNKLFLNLLVSKRSQSGSLDSDNFSALQVGLNLDYYY